MLRKSLFVFALLGAMLFPLSYGQPLSWRLVEAQIRSQFPGVPQLSADSLAAMLARGEKVVLLDARTEEEFAVSHLPGARRIEPSATTFDEVPAGATLVVYCSVGYRSSALAERLMEAGGRVYNLDGSIFRWANEGRPLVRDGGVPARTVHPYNRVWGLLLKRALRAPLD